MPAKPSIGRPTAKPERLWPTEGRPLLGHGAAAQRSARRVAGRGRPSSKARRRCARAGDARGLKARGALRSHRGRTGKAEPKPPRRLLRAQEPASPHLTSMRCRVAVLPCAQKAGDERWRRDAETARCRRPLEPAAGPTRSPASTPKRTLTMRNAPSSPCGARPAPGQTRPGPSARLGGVEALGVQNHGISSTARGTGPLQSQQPHHAEDRRVEHVLLHVRHQSPGAEGRRNSNVGGGQRAHVLAA